MESPTYFGSGPKTEIRPQLTGFHFLCRTLYPWRNGLLPTNGPSRSIKFWNERTLLNTADSTLLRHPRIKPRWPQHSWLKCWMQILDGKRSTNFDDTALRFGSWPSIQKTSSHVLAPPLLFWNVGAASISLVYKYGWSWRSHHRKLRTYRLDKRKRGNDLRRPRMPFWLINEMI